MATGEKDRGSYGFAGCRGVSAPHTQHLLAATAVAWCFAAILLIVSAYSQTGFTSPVWGPDDAMRLVQVRDYLNGQGWFDLVQKRLDPADPVVMHWSRVVDVPLALMIAGFGLFTSPQSAEGIAAFIWPLMLLSALLALSGRLGFQLGGEKAMWAGVLIPLTAASTIGEFLPGRIDHHGLQIVLVLVLLLMVLQAHRHWRYGVLAGGMAPLLLSIGLEPLPFVFAAIAGLGLQWILCRDGAARGLMGFGGGMLAASPVFYLLTVPAERSAVNACDAFSHVHLAAACAGGAALVLLGLSSSHLSGKMKRSLAALMAGAVMAGSIVILFPECIASPYGHLDPRLKTLWLSQIVEAQGVEGFIARAPEKLLSYYLMPVAGLFLCLISLIREKDEKQREWLIFSVFLAVGLALALYQVRGIKFSIILAVPPGAWLVASLFERYRARPPARRYGALAQLAAGIALFMAALHHNVANSLASAAAGMSAGETAAEARAFSGRQINKKQRACWARPALAPLNRFAPGLALTPQNLGSHVLLESRHSVLAANYHRGGRGILLALDLYNAPEAEARNMAHALNLRYVIHCKGMIERRADGKTAPDALINYLERDEVPSWLVRVETGTDSPVKLYRVSVQDSQ